MADDLYAAIPCTDQPAMRGLRAWHWKKVVHYRAVADLTRKHHGSESSVRTFDQQANFHLGFVQLLNQFFEVGDYAANNVDAAGRG